MIKYNQFIEELSALKTGAKELYGANELYEYHPFRSWRHKVTDLLRQIKSEGYLTRCSIEFRNFGNLSASFHEYPNGFLLREYDRDLDDTLMEIDTIISNFYKFGEPQKQPKNTGNRNSELEWPQKITLSWLYHHAPIKLWIKLVAILIAAVGIGITIGQSAFYKDTVNKFYEGTIENETKSIVPNKVGSVNTVPSLLTRQALGIGIDK